jgi:hypothetical protein
MTALVLLLTESWKGQLSYRVCITAGVLLVLASFYRVHTILPLAGIALPFLVFTLSKKLLMRSLAVLLVSAICVFTFNWMHEAYYKSKKADWPKEEAYRQKIFRIVNGAGSLKIPRPGEKWYYEYQLATRGIIMDTAYLPSVSLDSAYYQLRESRTSSPKISRDWKKWFWINNRLFFFLTLFIVLLFGLHKKILPATLTAIVLIIAGFGYLILKAKAPPYLLISALSFFSFTIFLHGKDQFITTKKNYGVIALVIALLFTAWGAVRLYRTSNMNLGVIKQFKDQYAEMAAHPDKLFIHIRGFYSHRFAVMDPPSRFPLTNYLHAEHFTSNIYQETLQTYHIHNTREIFSSPDVLFWGKPTDEAMAYFEKVAGRPLVLEGPLNEFKTGSVWKVK